MDIVDAPSLDAVESEALDLSNKPSVLETLECKWVSAAVVACLSFAMACVSAVGVSIALSIFVVVCAGVFLALGWSRLVKVMMPLPSQAFIALCTLACAVTVGYVRDQSAIVFVVSVSLAFLVGVELWTAPSPRDHSSVVGLEGVADDERRLSQRVSWVSSSATSSLAGAMSGAIIAVGGTAWIAMAGEDSWRLLVPVAAVIVAAVVIGDQIGSTWIGQALWALMSGVVTGALGSAAIIALGHGKTVGHVILPALSRALGPELTVVTLGVGTGVVVAVVVMVIDAVMGDHEGDGDILSALSRGAMKFLLCGLLIYTVIRVAGA